MKCCNKEDILYTTGHNELYVRKYVGMEGYLANSTEELMEKYKILFLFPRSKIQ